MIPVHSRGNVDPQVTGSSPVGHPTPRTDDSASSRLTVPDGDRNGSRLGSAAGRRATGTGEISQSGSYWVAGVSLRDGRRVRRKRHTREEAEVALAWLLENFADRLGCTYEGRAHDHFCDHPPMRNPRAGITAGLRFRVFDRDGFKCRYCGAPAPEVRLTVDHVLAVAKGGSDDIENLATACRECNLGKSDMSLGG